MTDLSEAVTRLRDCLHEGLNKRDWGISRDQIKANDLAALIAFYDAMQWRPIAEAPKDGSAFLGYGVHDHDAPLGASREVKAGDHWWGIILWDVWRGAPKFVFSKDGATTWSAPTHFIPLSAIPLPEGER